jgi:hypothetical protein
MVFYHVSQADTLGHVGNTGVRSAYNIGHFTVTPSLLQQSGMQPGAVRISVIRGISRDVVTTGDRRYKMSVESIGTVQVYLGE